MDTSFSDLDESLKWLAFVDVLATHHYDFLSDVHCCACGWPVRTRHEFARHQVECLVSEGALPAAYELQWAIVRERRRGRAGHRGPGHPRAEPVRIELTNRVPIGIPTRPLGRRRQEPPVTPAGTVGASGSTSENTAIPRNSSHLLQHQMPVDPDVSTSSPSGWHERLAAASSYRQAHGSLADLWTQDESLMRWIQNQRVALRAGRLSTERIALLDRRVPGWKIDGRSALARYQAALQAWLEQNPGATVADLTDRDVVEIEGEQVRVGRRHTYYRRRRRLGKLDAAMLDHHGMTS